MKRQAICILVSIALTSSGPAVAATSVTKSAALPIKPRPPLSDFTYGLASGPSWSTEFAVAGRLAALAGMDQEAGPHGESGPKIASLIETSEQRSIDDLLTAPTTDLAILTVPAMERAAAERPAVRQRIAYVAPIYLEAVHLLTRSSLTDLPALTGKRVAVGSNLGSGAALIDALGIHVEPVELSDEAVLEALTSGQVDAAILVSGKPVTLLASIEATAGLHLLSIPYSPELERNFVPTTLTHVDYPGLTEASGTSSVAVPAVLAAYRWPPRSERAQTLGVLVATILEHLSKGGSDLAALKLKEVNWAASYPGWERLPAATRWLKEHDQPQSHAAPKKADPVMDIPKKDNQ